MKKHQKLIVDLIFIVCCLIAWQLYAKSRNIMAFPGIDDILKKLFADIFVPSSAGAHPILQYLGNSIVLILKGLGIGAVLAFAFSGLSVISEIFNTIYNLVVSVFDLLPGVALMPILMITVGANDTSIVILVVHSVIWPMSRSIIDGFKSVPQIHVESGRNIGLNPFRLVFGIYIPSSFASILSGIRVGWARAWRGLIAAEMIFGAAQSAGIGVFIHNARTVWMDYVSVYASMILIIIVGIIVEYGIFANIEKHTVKKWGMVR